MHYSNIHKAIFLNRPNRFIAHVMMNGKKETVHVKNTGRCNELLVPNSVVYLEESDNTSRKTKYDLIAVEKSTKSQRSSPTINPALPQTCTHFQTHTPMQQTLLINMDSQAPNKVAAEWICQNKKRFPHIKLLKAEHTKGHSRFDFYAEYDDETNCCHKVLIEVKGCTLEKDGIALFPDAPTLRGLKHVKELTELSQSGQYECMILIIVQMTGCKYFTPNRDTHADFAEALKVARKAGVKIIAIECEVSPDTLIAKDEITVHLDF